MGPLFLCGFQPYLANGMPWGFQKGLFCSAFYHLYAHDTMGILGTKLRSFFKSYVLMYTAATEGMDDDIFPVVFISAFMHITAVLQLPELLGPSFSPFTLVSFTKRSIILQTPPVENKHNLLPGDRMSGHITSLKFKAMNPNKRVPAAKIGEQKVKEVISTNGELIAAEAKKKKKKKKSGGKKED
jgi:hypothetical protein